MRPARARGGPLGLLGAAALTRFLASLLSHVPLRKHLTFGVVALVLVATAFGARIIPARRATATDPTEARRYE